MATADPCAPLHQRYRFDPPAAYRELLVAGCLDPYQPSHLQFSDLHWLDPERSAAWRFHDDQLPGLVPIAHTEQHDCWCWYPALNDGGPAPVVFCPDEDEVASILAPDFTSWLYRLLLEEFACTGLTEHVDVRQSRRILREYTQRLAPFFSARWSERLADLSSRSQRADANDYYGVLDEDELATILAEDLGYARLDEEFEHVVG